MKTTRIFDKIEKFLSDRPRNTAEILEHINSTMRHGTTSQQLGNVLSKNKNIVKIGYIKSSGILSGGYDICEWATRTWVSENCPEWVEGTPIIVDGKGRFTASGAAASSRKMIHNWLIGWKKDELMREEIANEIHEIGTQGRTLNQLLNTGNVKYQEDFDYLRMQDSVWSFSNIFDKFERIDNSNSLVLVSPVHSWISPKGMWSLETLNDRVFFASGFSQYLLYCGRSTKTTYRALGILQSTINLVRNDVQAHDKRVIISLLNDVGMAYHILQDKTEAQKSFTLALRELDEDNSKISISTKDKLRTCLEFNLKQTDLINTSRKERKIMIKNHAIYQFVSNHLDQAAFLFLDIFNDLSYSAAERWWAANFLGIIYPESDWVRRSIRITKEENYLPSKKDTLKFINWKDALLNPEQQDWTMIEKLGGRINRRSDSQISNEDTIFQLGKIAEIRGDLSQAERCFLHSLALVKEVGDKTREVIILNELGKLAEVRGHPAEAERFSQACRSILEQIDENHEDQDSVDRALQQL